MQETTTQRLTYIAVAIIALATGLALARLSPGATENPLALPENEASEGPSCNVALVKLQGTLVTYDAADFGDSSDPNYYDPGITVSSERLVKEIEDADASSTALAIVLQVDSVGGSPVAAEEIARALRRADKPTVAMIRGEGLSAAYWSSTGADAIFAAENAEVGSIGVTSSYLDRTKYDEKNGYTFHAISTGEYKDMLNSSKPLTKEEESLVRDEIGVMLENFIRTISENRGLSTSTVSELATGAPFIAAFAKENGLIDEIGDKETVRRYLSELLKKPKRDIVYCD